MQPECRLDAAWHEEDRIDGLDQLIGLHQAESTDTTEDREEERHRTPILTQTLDDHIHRTALQVALRVATSVHRRQRTLEEFGCHTDHRAHPHPEDCARAANAQCDCHTGDVAHTDRSCDCATQSLPRGDLTAFALAAILCAQSLDRATEIAERHHTRVKEEKQSAANQHDKERITTYKVACLRNKIFHFLIFLTFVCLINRVQSTRQTAQRVRLVSKHSAKIGILLRIIVITPPKGVQSPICC